jgi:hypothetical protein
MASKLGVIALVAGLLSLFAALALRQQTGTFAALPIQFWTGFFIGLGTVFVLAAITQFVSQRGRRASGR